MSANLPAELFRCYYVTRDAAGVKGQVAERPIEELPPGEVVVRVAWSSLNYKDALAATAHPGVVRKLPHVPGIDAAGIVECSSDPSVKVGQQVIVTSYELGAGQWGGWSELIRVPAAWVVPLPAGLTLREAMLLGTAGFTAAQSVAALEDHGVLPDTGDVVVTGASGGVGSLAVRLLAKLGYRVFAVSGKASAHEKLLRWGAKEILPRDASEINDTSGKPLLASRWAGAIDTVGGNTLATILKTLHNHGCVAACGLVGGLELPTSVYPFILRGVTLAGITSAWCPYERRLEMWRRLAGPWKLPNLEEEVTEVTLDGIGEQVEKILRGEILGRVLVKIGG